MSSISITNLITRPTIPKVKFKLTLDSQKIILLFMVIEFILLLTVLYLIRVKIPNRSTKKQTPDDILEQLTEVTTLKNNDKIWMYNLSKQRYEEYTINQSSKVQLDKTRTSDKKLQKNEYWDIGEQNWKYIDDGKIPQVDNNKQLITADNNLQYYSFLRLGKLYEFDNIKGEIVTKKHTEFPIKANIGDILPWTYKRYMVYLGGDGNYIDENIDPDKEHNKAYFKYESDRKWNLKFCLPSEYFSDGACIEKPNIPKTTLAALNPAESKLRPPNLLRRLVVFNPHHYEFFVWITANQTELIVNDLPVCGYNNVRRSFSLKLTDRQRVGTLYQRTDSTAFNGRYLADLNNSKKIYIYRMQNEILEYEFNRPIIVVDDIIYKMNEDVFNILERSIVVDDNILVDNEIQTPHKNKIIVDSNLQERIIKMKHTDSNLFIYLTAIGSIYLDMIIDSGIKLELPEHNIDMERHFSLTDKIQKYLNDNTLHYTVSSIYSIKQDYIF